MSTEVWEVCKGLGEGGGNALSPVGAGVREGLVWSSDLHGGRGVGFWCLGAVGTKWGESSGLEAAGRGTAQCPISQSIPNWKGPIQIIESDTSPHTAPPKDLKALSQCFLNSSRALPRGACLPQAASSPRNAS